jgi:hypothetical protein
VRASDFYGRLASEPGDFAVLNVPVDPYQSKPYMFAQVVHRRPILQGHSSRYPKGTFDYLDGQPWLRAMRRYSDLPPKQLDVGRQLSRLAEEGVRYLVVHKRAIGDDRWRKWARYLAVEPRFEDGDIAVYATTPIAGQDYDLAPEVASGVGVIRTVSSGPCLDPGRAYELDVAWGTTAAPGRDLDVGLALLNADGEVLASSVYPLSEGWPTGEWPPGAIAWGHYVLPVPADARAGDTSVVLGLFDTQTGASLGSPVVVEQGTISSPLCSLVVPPDAADVNATFGEPIRLLGYRVEQVGDELDLTLYWRADRRMKVDYKVFVHVYDPATGIPVAQDDAMPQHWTYPTGFWDPGEVVVDEIRISLAEAPAGSYGLAVGVYDPASGVRLPILDETGQVQPDDRLVLQGEGIEVR